ncbi:hypothetical protein BC567DRAFT_73451 [Phyllosticta citribraziliensis]
MIETHSSPAPSKPNHKLLRLRAPCQPPPNLPPTSIVLMNDGNDAKSFNSSNHWQRTESCPRKTPQSPEQSETSRRAESPGTAEAFISQPPQAVPATPPLLHISISSHARSRATVKDEKQENTAQESTHTTGRSGPSKRRPDPRATPEVGRHAVRLPAAAQHPPSSSLITTGGRHRQEDGRKVGAAGAVSRLRFPLSALR